MWHGINQQNPLNKKPAASIRFAVRGRTEGNQALPLFNFGYGVDSLVIGFTFKIKFVSLIGFCSRADKAKKKPPQQQYMHVMPHCRKSHFINSVNF